MRVLGTLSCLFLPIVCHDLGTQPEPPKDSIVTLSYGESAIAGSLSLTFVDVEEDSRCPAGAVCIWEGNARIVVRLARDDKQILADFNSTVGARVVTFEGYTIELKDVAPYPTVDSQIDKQQYIVRLKVRNS